MRANPAEEMRWCSLGCGLELPADGLNEHGRCPKCDSATVAYGWRYRNGRGTYEYASSWDTLPVDVRRATTR